MYCVPLNHTFAEHGNQTVNGGLKQVLRVGSSVLALSLLLATNPASAQTAWNPGLGSTDWTDAENWTLGAPDENADVIVDYDPSGAGGPIISSAGESAGTLTIGTSFGGSLTLNSGGELTTGALIVGREVSGGLFVNSGGMLRSAGIAELGQTAGYTGTVNVTAGSWMHEGLLTIGAGGAGVVNVLGGGTVATGQGSLSVGSDGNGNVSISGVSSSWTHDGDVVVGDGATGNLWLTNGGALSATGTITVNDGSIIRIGASSATVNPYASTTMAGHLSAEQGLTINGTGQLLLNYDTRNGSGNFDEASALDLSSDISGDGVINIAGGATLFSGDVSTFSGLILLGRNDVADISAGLYLRGDTRADIAYQNGNGVLFLAGDDNFTVSSAFTGSASNYIGEVGPGAGLHMVGSGTVTLSGENDFTGNVRIDDGVLQIASNENLGDANNSVYLNGGSLAVSGDVTSGRTFGLLSNSGGFGVADGATLTLAGATISGSGALNLMGPGTLDLGNAAATYGGGVNVGSGTLIGDTSTILGNVANAGTVRFLQTTGGTFGGETNGSGQYIKDGVAELILAAESASDWEVAAGTLSATAGQYSGDTGISENGEFRLTGGAATYGGAISGDGVFTANTTGRLTLTGNSGMFAGTTDVLDGELSINNQLGGDVNVAGGGALSGIGTIGGDVSIAGTGALIGEQGQVLTVAGNVELASGSQVNVTLGEPKEGFNPALFDVGGDLTLNGTINVTDAGDDRGNFRAGVYRIFDYAGQLNGNGLAIGSVPGGSDVSNLGVQTAIDGQVNLVNSGGQAISWWDGGLDSSKNDGIVQGGNGIWRNGDANWANEDATANAGWDSGLAVFAGAAGTVTIDTSTDSGGPVSVGGLQFLTDGYRIEGDGLILSDDDGTTDIGTDADVTATIDVALSGDDTIDKWGAGTLIIESDSRAYGGAIQVSEGTLLVEGHLGGDVSVDASLGGGGQIHGHVSVNDGGILLGQQGQTLSMGGLTLSDGAEINVALDDAGNSNGLFFVDGDLSLAGTINVSDAGGFGRGVYRIIDYTGELTRSELEVGLHPGAWDLSVQDSIGQQINLIVGSDMQFWNGSNTVADGTIHGGDGVWRNDSRTNWTDQDGQDALSWQQDIFAVFQGEGGTVTVDSGSGQISVDGMNFAVDGYTVVGDSIALNGDDGQTIIRVGDGNVSGAEYVAVVEAELTGTTGLEKTDLGTLVLTGENSYGGGTTVSHGGLVIGYGGTTGSIVGDVTVADDARFIFNRSNEYAFGGVIDGAGLVGQIGSGTTVLSADSSGFLGTTEILNGGLRVENALGGLINVRDGALLDGTGAVGDVVVHNGGTIGAGTSTSIGEFHTGELTFNAGSGYLVNVAADGTGDRIFSREGVVINGGVVDVLAGSGNYADQTRYTIITAENGVTRGGDNDGFDDVTSNLAFLTPSLEYDEDNVYLVMDRNDRSFCLPGSTANQCATGEGAESTGPGAPIYDTVLNLTDPEALDAFDQLSGEIHASALTAMIEDSRFVREATGDRIRSAFGMTNMPQQVITWEPGIDIKDPTPRMVITETDQVQGPALWGHGFGSRGQFEGDGNAADLTRSIGGFFAGVDVPVFDSMRLGVVGGYSHSAFSVDDRNSSGSSDNYDLGIYGGGQWDQLGVRFGANYTWHDLSTSRGVAYRGFSDSLTANYNARTVQAYGDIGYTIDIGGTTFEPFAGLAHVNYSSSGFSESGGDAALTGLGGDMSTTFATIGLRAEHTFSTGEFELTASGMVGWRHALGDTTPTSTHQFEGGTPFTISGVPLAQDVAVFEAGLNAAINDALNIGVSYSGQVGSDVSDHGVRGNLSWKF